MTAGFKRRIGLVLAVVAAVQPVGAQAQAVTAPVQAAPVTAPAGPRPAIWVVEDEDTRIYLFGTVHVFPASLRWRSAALDRVIAEADELVMETPDAAMDASVGARLSAPMQMRKAVPILQRVAPHARPALAALLAATPLPIEAYDAMHTWAVAFTLIGFQMGGGAAGGGEMTGAEEVLGRLFRKSGRPISGVETLEGQMAVFSTMTPAAQSRFLEETVTGGETAEGVTADRPEASVDADRDWVEGDVDAIAREMSRMSPELYDALLTRRNRNWTEWLQRRLERPGTVLFAVGAGHLAGEQSVQTMLAQRGITARRIN